jgi:hypothetical protein
LRLPLPPNTKGKTDVIREVESITNSEVIDAGLMREKVVLNDGLDTFQGDESLDTERVLLELAFKPFECAG